MPVLDLNLNNLLVILSFELLLQSDVALVKGDPSNLIVETIVSVKYSHTCVRIAVIFLFIDFDHRWNLGNIKLKLENDWVVLIWLSFQVWRELDPLQWPIVIIDFVDLE